MLIAMETLEGKYAVQVRDLHAQVKTVHFEAKICVLFSSKDMSHLNGTLAGYWCIYFISLQAFVQVFMCISC